jgi:3-hydroxybutyrate dehydrogenase
MSIDTQARAKTTSRMLEGKVALITGSTSGIGLGIAQALAAAGSAIVLNGFGKPDEIAATQSEISARAGVKVTFSGADMSNVASIEDMIESTLDTFGRLDIVVNNAGIQHVAALA